MAEYTITVTIHGEGDDVHVALSSSLGGKNSHSPASWTASALSHAVQNEVKRVLRNIDLAEDRHTTIHAIH